MSKLLDTLLPLRCMSKVSEERTKWYAALDQNPTYCIAVEGFRIAGNLGGEVGTKDMKSLFSRYEHL